MVSRAFKTYAVSKLFWLLPIALVLITASVYWQPNDWGYRLFMTALCLFGCGAALLMPLKVTLTADNKLVAQSVLRSTSVNIEDILLIEQNGKTTTIKHRGGKLELSYIINDLAGCCAELKARNPAIVEQDGKMLQLSRSPWFILTVVVGAVALAVVVILIALYVDNQHPGFF